MVIGIRREDKNEWEARVPLTPQDIAELRSPNLQFIVQPSPIRIFKEEDYLAAGASIEEDLSGCDIILGVKEIPPRLLLSDKTYLFFSHTIKGQKYNMPMLHRLLQLRDTLIDYERIVDEQGRRLVFFGRFAGIAGMIDSFWALGQRWAAEGHSSLFNQVKRALHYHSLTEVKEDFLRLSDRFQKEGLAAIEAPCVVGFTGYGHVSTGAQEIFDLLPHQEISPAELAQFIKQGKFSNKLLYKVVFREVDLVRPKKEGDSFDLQDYYHHPEKYVSRFEEYLPYLSVLINAIYWDARYPRLVTKKYLKQAYAAELLKNLKIIGDISCDIEGSIECTVEASTPGDPVYVYNPLTEKIAYGVQGYGPVILAVDNLPCELPRDASAMFSRVLKNFIPKLAAANYQGDFDAFDIVPELRRATIVYRGKLTPDYQYLARYLSDFSDLT